MKQFIIENKERDYKIMYIPEDIKECEKLICKECLLFDTVHCTNI